ncbi:MAG: hypothetical protein J5874_00795 [Oscillospiraceae bacterium]|nr:hypothetical protein [Oscillospiraceae bacterium]
MAEDIVKINGGPKVVEKYFLTEKKPKDRIRRIFIIQLLLVIAISASLYFDQNTEKEQTETESSEHSDGASYGEDIDDIRKIFFPDENEDTINVNSANIVVKKLSSDVSGAYEKDFEPQRLFLA